jgi:chitodextrinase
VDDGGGTRSHNLSVIPAAVLAAEEAYVRKVIDTVNDLPNVLYEIANEAGPYSTAWQEHFIAFIRNYEAGMAFQHPVGFTFQHNGGSNSTLYSSDADWISPADDLLQVNDGTHHVVLNDTDHSYYWVDLKEDGPQAWRAFVWRNFTVGNSALFMDPYLMPWEKSGNIRNAPINCVTGPSCTGVDPYWNPIRRNIGYMLDYANGRLDLEKMTPHGNLASTGYCLANAAAMGAEYLVYASSGGTFTVNLSATTRPILVEWLNPSTGEVTSAGSVTGGSSARSFTAPFSGDAVLYLADPAAHVPGTNYSDLGLTANTTYRYRLRAVDAEGDLSAYSNVAEVTTPAGTQITITTVELLGPGSLRIAGVGATNTTYNVQMSSSLNEWEALDETTTDGNGAFEYVDAITDAVSQRFYRIVTP